MPYKVDGPPPHARDRAGARRRLGRLTAPPLTFVPHLLPLDQGELVSCYVRTSRARRRRRGCSALYEERYADEPFVEVTSTSRPGVRDVRDTNLCRIHVALDEAPAGCWPSPRSTTSGRAPPSQAIQNLNLMLGLPEGEGIS